MIARKSRLGALTVVAKSSENNAMQQMIWKKNIWVLWKTKEETNCGLRGRCYPEWAKIEKAKEQLAIPTLLATTERRKESLQVARMRNARHASCQKKRSCQRHKNEHTKWLPMRTGEAPPRA